MLCLSRKPGDRVVISGGIVIDVLEVKGHQIRLGITAPPDVTIRRSELSPLAVDQLRQRAGTALRIPAATEDQRP